MFLSYSVGEVEPQKPFEVDGYSQNSCVVIETEAAAS
jgi:hypothetical protein